MATPSLFPQFMKAQAGGTGGGSVTVVVNGTVRQQQIAGTVGKRGITATVGKRGITSTLGKRGITGTIRDSLQGTLGNQNLDGDLK